jgi:hypothetical protein
MVIIKFALLFFLITLVWMVTLRQNRGPVYGGPFYYADPPNSSNPVRPQYRLNFKQAWDSDRYVEVYTNDDGLPVLAKYLSAHEVMSQMVWIWSQNGQLMRRYTEDAQGNILKTDVMPWVLATPTPSTSPLF